MMSDMLEQQRPEDQVSFSFQSRTEDILQAARVIDKKNKLDSRRNIQSLGVVVILWMFVPDAVKNPTRLMSWLMILLALGLLWMIWKYPDISNRKYASRKAAAFPEYHLDVSGDGIDITEGSSHNLVPFENCSGVFEYQNIFAVGYQKNNLLAIPKDQLEEATLEKLRGFFHQGLGDRFEKIDQTIKQAGLFGSKKH